MFIFLTLLRKLDMCKPWEVAKLAKRLRHLLEYHIRHLEALTHSKLEVSGLVAHISMYIDGPLCLG